MAYIRWSTSDWYIFWNAQGINGNGFTNHKHQQTLSCWLAGESQPTLDYLKVKEVLKSKDTSIWGELSNPQKEELFKYMKIWIREVDEEWKNKKWKNKNRRDRGR